MTPFSNVLHPGNSSSRGQNTGEFKQHIFEESPQGIRIIDSNLKPSFKRVLGLRATLWWGGVICPSADLVRPHGQGCSQCHGAPYLAQIQSYPSWVTASHLDHSSLPPGCVVRK